jgi:hypothetical protein
MRVPRMTTRRWMIVVAVVALSLGAYVCVARLKRQRDRYLAKATWHSGMEAESLRFMAKRLGRPVREPKSETSDDPVTPIDPDSGLLTEGSNRHQLDDYQADQEVRERATAAARRRILEELWQRDLEHRRKQAEYHAALARKYRDAARYPWLTVEPDPGMPQ